MIQTPELKKPDIEGCFPKAAQIDVMRPGGQKQAFKIKTGGTLFVAKFVHIGDDSSGREEYSKETLKRLVREVKLISSVKSRYLPKSGSTDPGTLRKGNAIFYYYTEEYIPGPDLRELIQKKIFPTRMTPNLVKDIVTAIKCLWEEQECVHRDIKPENIIFDKKNKRFVLVDPGIALFLTLSSITPVGFPPVGTLPYFSPEQVKGSRRQLDFRSDVYSLGIVAYEVITGNHPYFSPSMDKGEIAKGITNTKPPSLLKHKVKLPKTLLETVDRMLKKNPHARFNSCDKILDRV